MLPQIAKAIIYLGKHFLLQHRDDKPEIAYPNQWSFFGGEIELDETPWLALQRELEEELGWFPRQGTFLFHWNNPENPCRIHFFAVPFTGSLQQFLLQEGQSYGWFSFRELKDMDNVAPHVGQILNRFL